MKGPAVNKPNIKNAIESQVRRNMVVTLVDKNTLSGRSMVNSLLSLAGAAKSSELWKSIYEASGDYVLCCIHSHCTKEPPEMESFSLNPVYDIDLAAEMLMQLLVEEQPKLINLRQINLATAESTAYAHKALSDVLTHFKAVREESTGFMRKKPRP